MKGWGVCLYNEHQDKDISTYDINYTYYIHECNKIIQALQIEKEQLTLF